MVSAYFAFSHLTRQLGTDAVLDFYLSKAFGPRIASEEALWINFENRWACVTLRATLIETLLAWW